MTRGRVGSFRKVAGLEKPSDGVGGGGPRQDGTIWKWYVRDGRGLSDVVITERTAGIRDLEY
jgi:hypothetical protein